MLESSPQSQLQAHCGVTPKSEVLRLHGRCFRLVGSDACAACISAVALVTICSTSSTKAWLLHSWSLPLSCHTSYAGKAGTLPAALYCVLHVHHQRYQSGPKYTQTSTQTKPQTRTCSALQAVMLLFCVISMDASFSALMPPPPRPLLQLYSLELTIVTEPLLYTDRAAPLALLDKDDSVLLMRRSVELSPACRSR